jgi:hypothetical protein
VTPSDVFIDVKNVGALTVCKTSPTLELGGGMNIGDVIATLEAVAKKDGKYFYGKAMVAHLKKVSHL